MNKSRYDDWLMIKSRYEGVQCCECRCDLRAVLSRNRPLDLTGGILCGAARCPTYVCDTCYVAHLTLHQLKGDPMTLWYHDKRMKRIGKSGRNDLPTGTY